MDSENKSQKETTKALEIALEVEELEKKIAPGRSHNHNETLIIDPEIELEIEELEAKINPGISVNHNETLAHDTAN